MLKKLLASSSGNKNGSSNIYMNGREIYKVYRGKNLVYDVWNGRDFDYKYNYANQKFTFTNWKQTVNCAANTTHLILADDPNIVLSISSIPKTITNVVIPYNINYKSDTYYYDRFGNHPNLVNAQIEMNPTIKQMYKAFYNCVNLQSPPVCGKGVTNMALAYSDCINMKGDPVCGPNVTDMGSTYYNCSNLTGQPVCSDNVTDMYRTYYDCRNITGSPVCGDNVTDMSYTYYNCSNLTGSPACGDKVTSMDRTYYNCRNLTGSPVCGPKVTTMNRTYSCCFNITGNPVCGDNVTDMTNTYHNCYNITGSPVCGNNVTDMNRTYFDCRNLTGSPICGPNVTNMSYTYYGCYGLTGNPVCGPNVTNMYQTYVNCQKLTGSPVCGDNVTNMSYTYYNCFNLTGSPVCGNLVTSMNYTYANCYSLTGSPACGNSVVSMNHTYASCSNLTGYAVVGPNVTYIDYAYYNCTNLKTNAYFYSNKVNSTSYCFYGKTDKRLNIYVPNIGHNETHNTLSHCIANISLSYTYHMFGTGPLTWTNDIAANNCYYNTVKNTYIYPVSNVANAYRENELLIVRYTISNGSNIVPEFKPYLQGLSTIKPVYDYSQEIEIESIDSIISIMCGDMDLLKYTSYNYSDPINNYYQFSSNGMDGIKLEKIEDGKWDISGYGGSPGMYADIIVTYQAINHDYSIEDTVNSDNTITKAIYIEESKIDKMPTSISFKNETDLLTVDKLRIDNITDTSYMFNGCSNLTSVCALDWDTSKITKADYMFAGCSKLIKESFVRVENGNTKQFELPNVKSAICIFDGCINLK